MRPLKAAIAALAVLLPVVLTGCTDRGVPFTIISGSENQGLEPIVTAYCASQRVACKFVYNGSLDIALSLKGTASLEADAVWPAASLWIDVFDTSRRMKSVKSIAQLPLILGVRRSKAEALGWIGKSVTTRDILAAVEGGRLKFLMASATQSNSGAAAYLAMLASAIGKTTDPITLADLNEERVRTHVKGLLRGIERSAGSSGWLADLYRANEVDGQRFEAMWNYEATIKETNDQLTAAGQEPLYAIYPTDGVAIADSPLGFVERGRGPATETFFLGLQAHLLEPTTQQQIAMTGRRMGLGGRSPLPADSRTNLDPNRPLVIVQTPEPVVIRRALDLYQEGLRRPSLTAICLDLSGSMQGVGERQLLDAMTALLTPATTREYLIQWSPSDQIFVLPFDSKVRWVGTGTGSEADQAAMLAPILGLRANGGTDFYTCAELALQQMKPALEKGGHLPAIVIMTDGKSQGSVSNFAAAWRADPRRVPVFGILFGAEADRKQVNDLAALTGGRVFDGTSNLAEAFRTVRGYN
jgi:Ca-activated chloride channel homolog